MKQSSTFEYQIETVMKRQSIMDTYKELQAVKRSFDSIPSTPATKLYWVGLDECGILVATLCIQDTTKLSEVHTIEAEDSFKAKLGYNTFMASEGQASAYFESL